MIWRVYLSDEGTLQLLMNYLFVSVRIYSSDEYPPAVEGSENVPKTKGCTEKSRPSQVAKILSYFQESSVMDSCMVAYHREQRPLFLVLVDSMSFTYAIARLRVEIEKETHACDVPVVENLLLWTKCNNEEKCFPSTSKRSTSRREYSAWH